MGWWAASVVGVVLLTRGVRNCPSAGAAATMGFFFGVGLGVSALGWMSWIHPAAAVALISVMALWYVALAAVIFVAGRTRGWPLLAAGTWVAMEFAASRVPFNGFGWLRLGFTAIDSPFAGLLPLIGVSGAGLVTALSGQLIAWLVEQPDRKRMLVLASWIALAGGMSAVGGLIPPLPSQSSIDVGWVQGGRASGDVLNPGRPREIAINQAKETTMLTEGVGAARLPAPAIVVWPESSTDLDPSTDRETRALVESALRAVGRPILVGSVLDGPGLEQRRTAAQWWTPGKRSPGPTYVKRSIVPFGEWIPYRDVLLPLFPALRYVGAQSVPGNAPGLLQTTASGRSVVVGVLICFDVVFDPVVYDLAPAELLVVQSNNAMYQGSSQPEQQFAITRARAAELRREVLVVTTSGMSGVIDPYGKVMAQDAGPGPANGVVSMPRRTGATPATWLAGGIEWTVSSAAMLWLSGLALAAAGSARATACGRRSRIA